MKDIGIFNIEKTQGIGKLPLNIEITEEERERA